MGNQKPHIAMKSRLPAATLPVVAALLFAGLSAANAAVVTYIDKFTTLQTNSTFNTSATNTVTAAEAVGGSRTLTMTSTDNDIDGVESRLRVQTNAPAGPRLGLTAGLDAVANYGVLWGGAGGTTGLGGVDFTGGYGTNFNLLSSTLNYSLLTASVAHSYTWKFTDTTGNEATYAASFPQNLSPSPAINYAISLASFTGANTINWSSINFISLAGGGVPSLNMTFNGGALGFSVTAAPVPEPGTWAAAALLVLTTFYIRRRRMRTAANEEAPAAA